MKLWIRSQDKRTLIQPNRIDIDDKAIIVWQNNYNCDETYLATYKTKERALEVLDEIHERIAILTTIKLIGIDDKNLKVFNECLEEKRCSVVYEMPKE